MDEIVKYLPAKYVAPATLAFLLVTQVGRVYHAVAAGTGLRGIWNGLIYGTNAPKDALSATELANLRATVIKDVPAGQPIPAPTAPVPVQQNKLP